MLPDYWFAPINKDSLYVFPLFQMGDNVVQNGMARRLAAHYPHISWLAKHDFFSDVSRMFSDIKNLTVVNGYDYLEARTFYRDRVSPSFLSDSADTLTTHGLPLNLTRTSIGSREFRSTTVGKASVFRPTFSLLERGFVPPRFWFTNPQLARFSSTPPVFPRGLSGMSSPSLLALASGTGFLKSTVPLRFIAWTRPISTW